MNEGAVELPERRVLVIETGTENRGEIQRLLRLGSRRPYRFLSVEAGASGIDAVLADPVGLPTCIIIDDHPPDCDAAQLLAALLVLRPGERCPVVVVTARDDQDFGRVMLRAGAEECIDRAWMTPASLTRTLENAVERWIMTRELRASETRFRTLVSAAPQPACMLDTSGRPVFVNERWHAYFGPLADRHAQGDTQAIFSPEESADIIARMQEFSARSVGFQFECRLRQRDGECRWHQMNAIPLRDVSGALTHWYAVYTDIHELKESDARLRLALEASKTGIWTWDLRTDAVTWSTECHTIHGIPVGEFAGTGTAFFHLVHIDDRTRVEAAVRAALAERILYQIDFRVVRPNGEVVWAQNLGRASYDGDGQPVRMLGTITDISRRKQIEEALRARERDLQTICDNSPDIIARFDRDLRHVFVNAAVERATGRRPSDFVGKTNRELGMSEELCDLWDPALQQVFASGRRGSIEFSVAAPDGMRHYSNRMVPEPGPGGVAEHVLVITQDITERKQAEDALRSALDQAKQAVLARDQLASLISHDLKNPLAVLSMSLRLLENKVEETSHHLLARAARQVRRMDGMLDDLLDSAMLQAGGKLALDLRPVDLAALVGELAEEHGHAAPRHHIELRVTAKAVVGTWDAKRLMRVIDNLLSNAIKFSPGGGLIRVELNCDEDGSWAVLRVQDEGIGIPEADRSRMFQWQSRAANARRIRGNGIGLAGTRDILQQHGGSIAVDSIEGKGSCFTVRLPMSPAGEAAPPVALG